MQPNFPVVVRFGRSKRRTKRVVSQTSREEVNEAPHSPSINSEIRILDDKFAERYQDEARGDRPKRPGKKRVMLRFQGGQGAFTHRRHQFMLWKGQAATNAVKTLQGCYTLARRELASWRRRAKPEYEERASLSSDTKGSPRQRVSSFTKSHSQNRSRPNSRNSVVSCTSVVSSLSSTTDLEEERRKEYCRSEFSLRARRSSSLEMKPGQSCFAETASGSHELLLLVNALPLNDSDEEDEDGASASCHLPLRKTVINGRLHVLRNEWV